MKNPIRLSLATLIFVIFLFESCAVTSSIEKSVSDNAKLMNPPEGKAMVYLYRTSILGFAVGLNVSLNDELLAGLYPNNFYLCTLDPGKYVFTGKGENEDEMVMKVEANKKYFIEVNPAMGNMSARVELDIHDETDGMKGVQKCRMIGQTSKSHSANNQPVLKEIVQQSSSENAKPTELNKPKEIAKVHLINNNTTPKNTEYLILGANFGQLVTTVKSGGSSVSVSSDRLTSFHIGYTDLIKFNEKLGLKTGAILSVDGGVINNTSIAIGYACIPVQAQYFFTKGFSAVGGLNFDIGLYSVTDGEFSLSDNSFERFFNPGLCFGLEAKLNRTFKVYANYNQGLNNIIASKYSSSSYSISKNTLQLGIGILLY